MGRGTYASGKWALGECARSGRKMLLRNMIADGYYPNLIVDPMWYEPKHPQESLPSVHDPVTLFRPAPDRSLIGATLNLGGSPDLDPVPSGGFGDSSGGGSGSGGAGGSSVSFGYELASPSVSFVSGSFFTLPLRILDQEFACVGSAATSIDFRTQPSSGSNKLQNKTCINTIVNVPDQNQWKDDILPTPAYSIQHVSLVGDGTPVFDFPALNEWRSLASSKVFGMDRPAAGTSRFLTFRVNIAETADLTTILASARWTLRYTRP